MTDRIRALYDRLREVIEDNAGSLRTIEADRFSGGVYAGQSPDAVSLRAASSPRVESQVQLESRHAASPPINGSYSLYTIGIAVTVSRHVHAHEKLLDLVRDEAKALAAQDGLVLYEALSYPGNLTQTNAGAVTGLVSGMVHEYRGSESDVQMADDAPGLIVTTHRFGAIMYRPQAVGLTGTIPTTGFGSGFDVGFA